MSNSFKTAACTALRSLAVLVLGVSAFAVSCVREGADNPDRPVRAGEIRIEYSVDGVENATRSVTATAAERLLKDVHVMFFNNDGTFIACQKADVTNGSSFFSFPVPEGVVEGVEYKTLIVGNALSWLPSGSTTFEEYLNTMSDRGYKTIHDNLAALTSGRIDVGKGLPMWGEVYSSFGGVSGFVLYKNNTGAYYFNGHIIFYRAVCRLDLTNKVPDKLVITKVKVCNYREGGHYFLQNVPFGNIQSAVDSEDGWIPVDVPSGSVQSVTAKVYTFPNTVSVVSQNDDQTTYLMIAGKYNGSATETYYRFNMAANGAKQLLQPNHCYTGVISNVTGPGSDTPGGAKDATIPMFDYNVSDWYGNGDIDDGGAKGGISISPKPPVSGFVIEAFDTSRAIAANGLVCSKKITVSVPETMDDYTISVSSSFDPCMVLFLTKYLPPFPQAKVFGHNKWSNYQFYMPTVSLSNNNTFYLKSLDILDNLQNGDAFYLNVFRSSPGEKDITGSIEINVKSKVGHDVMSLQIPVTIKSSNVVVDDIFFKKKDGNYIMIADRNVGTPQRFLSSGGIQYSEYFSTYDTGIYNVTSGILDSLNVKWDGLAIRSNYESTAKINLDSICVKWISDLTTAGPLYKKEEASKWRALSRDDVTDLSSRFMTGHNRLYCLSPYKNKAGKFVACFFPEGSQGQYSTAYNLVSQPVRGTYDPGNAAFYYAGRISSFSLDSKSGTVFNTDNSGNISWYLGGMSNCYLRCVRELSYGEFIQYVDILDGESQ